MNHDRKSPLLDRPRALPHLNIPISANTVEVRIINTTTYTRTKTRNLLKPRIASHRYLTAPSYAFMITNQYEGVNILFDLGMRKDWQNACPKEILPYISDKAGTAPLQVGVERDIVDIIDSESADLGITSRDIAAIVWSHHHFDHRGDLTRFPPTTKLIVGPGLVKTYVGAEIPTAEIQNRQVIELGSNELILDIGGFPAHDAFGDGSFYLLSCPGNSVGHLCGLARVKSSPTSHYILLGGDCAHHSGEFRPSPYCPLPQQVTLKSTAWQFEDSAVLRAPALKSVTSTNFNGIMIKDTIHPRKSATEPFYDVPREPTVHSHADACESIAKLEIFDAHNDVLVCISHDASLMNVLPFYPYHINDWVYMGYKQKLCWEFLRDFDLESTILVT